MKELLNDFLNYLKVEKNFSVNTIKSYKKDIEQLFVCVNIKSPDELTKPKIRAFLAELASEQLSPSTRRRKLASIRSFCDFLRKEGVIEINHAKDIDAPKVEKRLPKVMNVSEVVEKLDAITNIKDKAIMETMYALGCRVSELVSIEISKIDFEQKTIKVIGKGDKERLVPVNKSAISAIKKYLDTRNNNSQYLFDSSINIGTHMTDRAVRDIVTKYFGDNVHPHMFRHSCATHLHANGVDIRIIQEILGHSDINTTTIYTTVANEQMVNAYHNAHPRG